MGLTRASVYVSLCIVELRLRAWRLTRGETIYSLAAKAGISFVTVVRIEQGRQSPTVDMLEKLARALHVHVSDLLPPPPKRPRGRRRKERPS